MPALTRDEGKNLCHLVRRGGLDSERVQATRSSPIHRALFSSRAIDRPTIAPHDERGRDSPPKTSLARCEEQILRALGPLRVVR